MLIRTLLKKEISISNVRALNKIVMCMQASNKSYTKNINTNNNEQYTHNQLIVNNRQSYSFSNQYKIIQTTQQKITSDIQQAKSIEKLKQIFQVNCKTMNFIHRTVLLQKITSSQFDNNKNSAQFLTKVIEEVRDRWDEDFLDLTDKNARAVANIMNYISRKRRYHQLDEKFISVNFNKLSKLLNNKQFVMTFNSILKLNLLQRIESKSQPNPNNIGFTLQAFIFQKIDQTFNASLLISMWFNLLKFQKSSLQINNFFAQKLKMKNFKNNLIDYSQIIYCHNHSQGNRSVDLTYILTAYPTQLPSSNNTKQRISILGARQLSLMYEQLFKLKKLKNIYFSEQFNNLLQTCYKRIISDQSTNLRNISNVFNNMVQYQQPSYQTIQSTYHKYYEILKRQIQQFNQHSNLSSTNQSGKVYQYSNIDPLSFVSLFDYLIKYHKQKNNFIQEHIKISMIFLGKILSNQSIMAGYNESTFVRLLLTIQSARKLIQQRHPGKTLTLNDFYKKHFQIQIRKRRFDPKLSLGKIINFVSIFDIRSKEVCQKFKREIMQLPKDSNFQQRINRSCILNIPCKNCVNCFGSI